MAVIPEYAKKELDNSIKMTTTVTIQTCDGCPYLPICKFSEKYTIFQETVRKWMENKELDPGCVSINVECKYLKTSGNGWRT